MSITVGTDIITGKDEVWIPLKNKIFKNISCTKNIANEAFETLVTNFALKSLKSLE